MQLSDVDSFGATPFDKAIGGPWSAVATSIGTCAFSRFLMTLLATHQLHAQPFIASSTAHFFLPSRGHWMSIAEAAVVIAVGRRENGVVAG